MSLKLNGIPQEMVGNSQKLISVVIPTYNYAGSLRRAVMSVVEQLNLDEHELLVIDDGSTDETSIVAERLREELPQEIRFIHQKNAGPASARNLGIRETVGDWLVFLDADDEMLPSAIERLSTHIINYPETRLIIGGHVAVFPDGRQQEFFPANLPATPQARLHFYLIDKKIAISNGACAMHRNIFFRANNPEAFRKAEDIPDLAQALANYPCSTLAHPLARIYKHEDSLRHRLDFAKAGGLSLVDEVFSHLRLGPEFQHFKPDFFVQRCLSLFRSSYIARDFISARMFYNKALAHDWRVIFRCSYTSKALRLFLKG